MNNERFKNFRLVTEAGGNKTVLTDEKNKMLALLLESYYAEVERYIENILKSMYGDSIKFEIKRDLDGIYINAKNDMGINFIYNFVQYDYNSIDDLLSGTKALIPTGWSHKELEPIVFSIQKLGLRYMVNRANEVFVENLKGTKGVYKFTVASLI